MSEKEAVPCKVVLIGDSGVGKTSIINRYTLNTFSGVLTATPGASFTAKVVNFDKTLKSVRIRPVRIRPDITL